MQHDDFHTDSSRSLSFICHLYDGFFEKTSEKINKKSSYRQYKNRLLWRGRFLYVQVLAEIVTESVTPPGMAAAGKVSERCCGHSTYRTIVREVRGCFVQKNLQATVI